MTSRSFSKYTNILNSLSPPPVLPSEGVLHLSIFNQTSETSHKDGNEEDNVEISVV